MNQATITTNPDIVLLRVAIAAGREALALVTDRLPGTHATTLSDHLHVAERIAAGEAVAPNAANEAHAFVFGYATRAGNDDTVLGWALDTLLCAINLAVGIVRGRKHSHIDDLFNDVQLSLRNTIRAAGGAATT